MRKTGCSELISMDLLPGAAGGWGAQETESSQNGNIKTRIFIKPINFRGKYAITSLERENNA